MKKRYVIVGLGVRGIGMFLKPLVRDYKDVAEVVALCDINLTRLQVALDEAGLTIPIYTDFDRMLRDVPCDTVIVATKDASHDDLIVKALQQHKDVITEKPMTIDDTGCRRILSAENKSRGSVRVTFNYRYTPYATRVKELLSQGVIGDIYSIDLHWYLDTVHGADYYRRWHRYKRQSGGLFVHKATHHFDLVNWWLGQQPVRVYASGSRNYYVPDRQPYGVRCHGCEHAATCPFYYDIEQNDLLKRLYLHAETDDGYYRDRCVFSPDIDIEDTMGAIINYSQGAQLHYTLHSFMPYEGFQVAFNGSKGRLEAGVAEQFVPRPTIGFSDRQKTRGPYDPFFAARGDTERLTADEIRLYPLFGGAQREIVPRAQGGHGGGDVRLRDMLFRPHVPDPLGHVAGSNAGAMSILIGVAANCSMAAGMPVHIADLLTDASAAG